MSLDPYGFQEPTTTPEGSSQPVTRWVTIVGVPVLVLLFSFAYYASRTNNWMISQMYGIDLSLVSGFGTAGSFAGLVIGAAVGAAVGGAGASVLGILLYILGVGLLATGNVVSGLVLTAAGRYTFNVGAAASLARGPRNEGSRVAMFALMYAAINLGALLNTPMTWVSEAFGPNVMLGACAGFALLALFIAVPIFLLQLARPPESAEQVAAGLHPALLTTVGVTALIVVPTYTLWSLGSNLQWLGFDVSFGRVFFLVNPLLVIATATLLGILAGAASLARIQAPALIVAAVGAVLFALGLLPSGLRDLTSAALPLFIGQVMFGLGEPLFFAGVQARLLGGVHWRLAPVAAALLSACGLVASSLSSLMETLPVGGITGSVLGVGVLLGGIALGVYGVFDLRQRKGAVTTVDPAGAAPRPGS